MKKIVFFIFWISTFATYAQHAGIERHFKSYRMNLTVEQDKSFHKDTLTNEFYRYLPQYRYTDFFYGYLNPGTPVLPMIFSEQKTTHKFWFLNNYYPYIAHHSEIVFFDATKPFTIFKFAGGAVNQELVKFFHTQNVNPQFNFGFDINIINSDGHYMHNNAKVNSLSFFKSYTKRRYQTYTSFIFNKLDHFENGGISNDTVFENTDIRAQNLDVNLDKAQNSISQLGFKHTHEYRLGAFSSDTVYIDEDTVINRMYQGKMSFLQTIGFDRYFRIYEDVPGFFYPNIYTDSTRTFDSIALKHFEHGIYLKLDLLKKPSDSNILSIIGGIRSEFFDYYQITGQELYQFHNLSAKLLFKNRKHDFSSSLDYCFAGAGIFDVEVNALHKYELLKNIGLESYFKYSLKDPDRILFNYGSNHFYWSEDYRKTMHFSGGTKFTFKKYRLYAGANINLLSNYVIFDYVAQPKQIENANFVADAYIHKRFNLGKLFWDNRLTYQYISDKENLPLPDLLAFSAIYFKSLVFNDAAVFQTGLSGTYHSANSSYAYMPATGAYYLQNIRATGNYFMLGFHISAKVKRFRGFINVSNFNTMFMPRNNFIMLNVPDNPFAINFGISWEFYD
jgi:hypothetical protein